MIVVKVTKVRYIFAIFTFYFPCNKIISLIIKYIFFFSIWHLIKKKENSEIPFVHTFLDWILPREDVWEKLFLFLRRQVFDIMSSPFCLFIFSKGHNDLPVANEVVKDRFLSVQIYRGSLLFIILSLFYC